MTIKKEQNKICRMTIKKEQGNTIFLYTKKKVNYNLVFYLNNFFTVLKFKCMFENFKSEL